MNNAFFEKTMENPRKSVNVKLVTDEEKLVKLVAKPSFKSGKIFTSNLFAVHSIKERLLLNRPSYFGMCILDNSNCLMYHFHYNVIKKKI